MRAPRAVGDARSSSKIYESEENPEGMLGILVETSKLPFNRSIRARWCTRRRTSRGTCSTTRRGPSRSTTLLEEDSSDEQAVSALTALYEKLGKKAELLALERRRVADAPTAERRIELRLSVSRIQRSLGDAVGAASTLRENLAESPRHAESFRELARLFEETERFGELTDLLAPQAELALEAGAKTEAADAWAARRRAGGGIGSRTGTARWAITSASSRWKSGPCRSTPWRRHLATRGDHARAAKVLERLRVARRAAAPLTLRLADALSAWVAPTGRACRLRRRRRSSPTRSRARLGSRRCTRRAKSGSSLANLALGGRVARAGQGRAALAPL